MFTLRAKLFYLVLIGFTGLIAIIVWQIGIEANKVATNSINKSLEKSSLIVDTNISGRYDKISEIAKSLTKDGRILPLVYDEDSVTLQDLSYEFKLALDFSILFFTNGYGTILARSDRPEAVGHSMAGKSPLFDRALEGEDTQGILATKQNLFQLVVTPIRDNVASDIIRGTVALAYELSPEIAREISELTASDIGFYVFERNRNREIVGVKSLHSTNSYVTKELNQYFSTNDNWKSIYSNQEKVLRQEIPIGEDIFHLAIHPLANNVGENLGFVIATRSRSELLAPFKKLQRQVIGLGMFSLFVASLLAWLIASRISRPIVDLVSITKKIEDGNYPESSPYEENKDEVGLLYGAVIRMGRNLKDKANLENYLSALSDDIGDAQLDLTADLDDLSLKNAPQPKDSVLGSLVATQVFEAQMDGNQNIQSSSSNANTESISSTEDTVTVERIELNKSDITTMCIDGRYQIIRLLGVGAMGHVYLAKDLDLDEQVALKILKQKIFTEVELRAFKEEIRLARKITHRNILRTFDFGVWDGYYFITMEFVHGYDLAALIEKNGPLDTNIGVIMARQICSAIDAAHEQGIIHRDLKPGNILINRQGILKIMDFGLAMQLESEKIINKTKDGAILVSGTPKFMAPEQFTAEELDQRTDIYAVGIIMFYLFSGSTPFFAKDYRELGMMHIRKKPPSLLDKAPNVPRALADIVNKALEKKKEDRFSDIKELMEALQSVH